MRELNARDANNLRKKGLRLPIEGVTYTDPRLENIAHQQDRLFTLLATLDGELEHKAATMRVEDEHDEGRYDLGCC